MQEKFVAKSSAVIQASAKKVWEYLTTPELIKQYLFGTEAVSEWKVGSPIIYKGVWEGKTYEDKGIIQKFEPEKLLVCTYWSSFSGLPDLPENYQVVSYELVAEGQSTVLNITQDKVPSEQSKEHSEKNWGMVLQGLKTLLEK